jgi:hypothetical protein
MPRHYKAITNHVPIDYGADLNAIELYFNGKRNEFEPLFKFWNLRPLEFDDCGALVDQLKRRVTGFALDCNALPMRTPRQLTATVKAIARKPEAFLDDVGKYDPEAAARVYGAYAVLSDEHYACLEQFEWGKGPAPPAGAIAMAAEKVLGDLEAERRQISCVGGQPLILQTEFAQDLARIFRNFGGRTSRVIRYDGAKSPTYFEDGPFYGFLEIVVPPARPFAERAGFRLRSIRSLVEMARRARAMAAEKVLGDLEAERRQISCVGGQPLVLQMDFAQDLARIFRNFGGRTSRVIRYDGAKSPTYC